MSLKARLLLVIVLVALSALLVTEVATYSSLESYLYQRVDQRLSQSVGLYTRLIDDGAVISTCAGPVGDVAPGTNWGVAGQQPAGVQPSNATQIQSIQIRTSAGNLIGDQICPSYVNGVAYTPNVPVTIPGLPTSPQALGNSTTAVYFTTQSVQRGGPPFRVQVTTLAGGDQLVIAQPLANEVSTLHRLMTVEFVVAGAAMLLALAVGWMLVRVGLRPLDEMEAAAGLIAGGSGGGSNAADGWEAAGPADGTAGSQAVEDNLKVRLPGEDPNTEVGRLAITLNIMLTRLEDAFESRRLSESRLSVSEEQLRRFVADASHELRTPLAAISAYAELFSRGAADNGADLERMLKGIQSETKRMTGLVNDLLLLANLDEGSKAAYKEVEMTKICVDAVATSNLVGPEWKVSFSADNPVEVFGDAAALRQVLDNLLANIRIHTPPGTSAHVVLERRSQWAVITVTDEGPGMPQSQADHIFERFYRADPSRTRSSGGAGLGLSIVQAIVIAHGGAVSACSMEGEGMSFEVQLPVSAPPDKDS